MNSISVPGPTRGLWLLAVLFCFFGSWASAQSPGSVIRPGDFSSGLKGWWKLDSEAADWGLRIRDAAKTGLGFSGANTQFTLAAWVRLAGYGAGYPAVIYKQDASGHTGYGMALFNGGFRLSINDDTCYDVSPTGQYAEVGRWHHVAIGFDSAVNRVGYFRDGNVVGVRNDVTADPLACMKPFRIGCEDNTVHYFDGDGFTKAQKYAAGTNPTLSGDFFKVSNPSKSGNTFTTGNTGRTYVLERSTAWAGGSRTTEDTQGPLDSNASVTRNDTNSPAGAAFYRIRVTGPSRPGYLTLQELELSHPIMKAICILGSLFGMPLSVVYVLPILTECDIHTDAERGLSSSVLECSKPC